MTLSRAERAQYRWISDGHRKWARARTRKRGAIPGQPWDAELLAASRLYRRSRELFHDADGLHIATLQSSARALGSSSLLTPTIEYSPIARELDWALTARHLKNRERVTLDLRSYATSVFHEQNHRVLWSRVLPPPPRNVGPALYLYLNLAESLVVMLDDALADSLPLWQSASGYALGVLYGAPAEGARLCRSRREYRNYLHACAYSTYLTLGRFPEDDAIAIVRKLYGTLGPLALRAWTRSSALDPEFVDKTNPVWQSRHARETARALGRKRGRPLILPPDPIDNREVYLLTERVLDLYGV